MNRALELLDYYGEFPPANVTLALVHLKREGKPKRASKKRTTQSEALAELGQLAGQIGSAPQPVPDHLREMAAWAAEQLNRNAKPS